MKPLAKLLNSKAAITKQTWKILALLFAFCVVAGAVAYYYYPELLPEQQPGVIAPLRPGPVQPAPPPEAVDYPAAALQYGLQNAITDGTISGGNERMDISLVIDNVWDPMQKTEQVSDLTSQTGNSGFSYSYGDTLVLHVSSDNDETGGTDCYDSWYIVTLIPGEPVYKFSPAHVSTIQTTPTYLYQVTGVGAEHGTYVQYKGGTTPYWALSALTVVPRTTAANLDSYLIYGGTTLAALEDGESFVDTQGEQSNDVNLATTNEELKVSLVAGATNIGYGSPMYTISSIGKFEERSAVIIIATNATSIGVARLTDNGWSKVQDSTLTTDVAFWKKIPAQVPSKGQKFSLDIKIQIDASALSSSTAYDMMVWIIDFQLTSNVAIGAVSTGIPNSYGMVGEYGLDAVIFATAYGTSSGAATGMVLYGDWYTPA